jgi:hypothetical protein
MNLMQKHGIEEIPPTQLYAQGATEINEHE